MPAEAAPSFVLSPELGAPGTTVTLSIPESHYLTRVCRARIGDRVSATDGKGSLALLRLLDLGREVTAEVESLDRSEGVRTLTIWAGTPESQRADWMVEKLAELGVRRWQPLECERGRWRKATGRRERWQRLAAAALRQSRRRYLMEIADPASLNELVDGLEAGTSRWMADMEGESTPTLPALGFPAVGAIGPSSGFSVAESERLEHLGFERIRLSDGRLRTETAAIALAARLLGG